MRTTFHRNYIHPDTIIMDCIKLPTLDQMRTLYIPIYHCEKKKKG